MIPTFMGLLKLFILIGIGVYVVFTIIVVKQVKIMNSTLKVGLEAPIKLSSYLLLAFAILVFLFALFAL